MNSRTRHTRRIGKRTHRLCVAMVIMRKTPKGTLVLIVHKPRNRDAWQIPQGGVESQETPEKAGKRELLEETGIDLKGTLLRCQEIYQYDYPATFMRREKPLYDGQRLLFFASQVTENTVVRIDKDELDDFRWVPLAQIPRFIRRKDYQHIVRRVIHFAIKRIFPTLPNTHALRPTSYAQ